jgi:L-threonylcarbamoyladenylate synthase
VTIRLSSNQLSQAATLLRNGGLLAFPTETVYGLGADATNADAVAKVYLAKGRPSFNPLIVHVASLALAQEIAVFDYEAKALAQAFWPGPMSLVLPLRADAGICDLVSAGLDTVAIRVPAHPLAGDLLRAVGKPIAAPSANPSGQISPTTADHVLAGLMGKIDAVLDGGACGVGVESTILGTNPVTLLRAGGVSVEDVSNLLDRDIAERDAHAPLSAPGQLLSHYAPNAVLRMNATSASENEILIGFGPINSDLNLSPDADATEAAKNLFGHLRQADALATQSGKKIAVSPIPTTGLGLAINDRLTRAAAPRD